MPSSNTVDTSSTVDTSTLPPISRPTETSSTVDTSSSAESSSTVDRSTATFPTRSDLLRQYAEQDARLGSPNPRYKQCKLYCDRYLDVRVSLVGTDGLTDTDWDLTIF